MPDLLAQLAATVLVVAGVVALGLVQLLVRSGKRAWLWPVLGFGGLALALTWLRAAAPLWLALGTLAALWCGVWLLRSPLPTTACVFLLGRLRRPGVQAAVLLLAAPLMGLAWMEKLSTLDPNYQVEAMLAELERPVSVRPLESLCLYTDKGRRILACEPSGNPEWSYLELEAREAFFLNYHKLTTKLIRTAGPDRSHNCHGWTFAGGKCWLSNRDVDIILDDNGYQAVTDPQPGDLVIYRDANGVVEHSGVVAAKGKGDMVFVESHWGWLGRYIHPVGVQQFSPDSKYYRSQRVGHRLRTETPALTSN
jgi:hypothetical protein